MVSSIASSISSQAPRIISATAPKTATETELDSETATSTKDSKVTNATVAIDAGDAGVMAAALGFVAWML